MNGRRVALAVAGATLTLALSACSPTLLGSAAVVEGERIPISEIENAVDEVRDLQVRYGGPAELGPRAAHDEVHRRVIDVVFTKAAQALGVEVTEGEVAAREAVERANAGSEDAFIQAWALQNGITIAEIKNLIRRTILTEKMLAKISADSGGDVSNAEAQQRLTEHLVATAKGMSIRINPRYGTFDPEGGQIVPFAPDYYRAPEESRPPQAPPAVVTPGEEPAEPTDEPTDEPTAGPDDEPTGEPSAGPTDEPADEPADEPGNEPTEQP